MYFSNKFKHLQNNGNIPKMKTKIEKLCRSQQQKLQLRDAARPQEVIKP